MNRLAFFPVADVEVWLIFRQDSTSMPEISRLDVDIVWHCDLQMGCWPRNQPKTIGFPTGHGRGIPLECLMNNTSAAPSRSRSPYLKDY